MAQIKDLANVEYKSKSLFGGNKLIIKDKHKGIDKAYMFFK